jgi:predicted AlkP superfamily phosphohydrolase/phosphomutase
VLFVGIDAMDPDLARGLAAAGTAPALHELLQTAAWAPTTNPAGLVVGGVWPSIWSGVLPSRHGFYCYHQLVNGTYHQRRTSPEDIDRLPFWGPIAEAGLRVCALDVPLTPLRTFPGCAQVVDWGTHDGLLAPASSPASLLGQIERDVGVYALGAECDHYARRGAWRELRDRLIDGVEQRTRLTKLELKNPEWDLVMTVFSESHCAGHHLWPFHDRHDQHHDPVATAQHGDLLTDVYEALDRALHDLLATVGGDATLVVLLSHGMGPHFEGDHLLAEILRRLDDSYGRPHPVLVKRERILRTIARRRHERTLRRALREGPPGRARLIPCDSSRRFFKVFNIGLYSGIRVNLRGREPRGRVGPGPELDDLVDRLSSDLLDIVDPDSGHPHITRVLRTASIYQGERLDDLPDLLVEWDPRTAKVRAASDRIGVVHEEYRGVRTGDHRPDGLVFVRGPGIHPGPIEERVHAVDIAPTIATMLGVNLADTDGQPITSFVQSR